MRHLNPADSMAIDMLLANGLVDSALRPADDHLSAARRTLALLAHMPEVEPPADLVQRTLNRIAEAIPFQLPTAVNPTITRPQM